MSKFTTRHPVGVGVGVATFVLLCILSLYASWEARRLSRRMAEDHQLASTFLVEVHRCDREPSRRYTCSRKAAAQVTRVSKWSDSGWRAKIRRFIGLLRRHMRSLPSCRRERRAQVSASPSRLWRRREGSGDTRDAREGIEGPRNPIRSSKQLSPGGFSDWTRRDFRRTPSIRP